MAIPEFSIPIAADSIPILQGHLKQIQTDLKSVRRLLWSEYALSGFIVIVFLFDFLGAISDSLAHSHIMFIVNGLLCLWMAKIFFDYISSIKRTKQLAASIKSTEQMLLAVIEQIKKDTATPA